MPRRNLRLAVLVTALFSMLAWASVASAAERPRPGFNSALPLVSDGGPSSPNEAANHSGAVGHLPGVRNNIELVSKLEMDTPASPQDPGGGTAAQQIADVAVYKNAAYLTSWAQPVTNGRCTRGGLFSVDISDPDRPRQLAFRAALPGNYHGEGAHAITIGARDVLAVNNETCTPGGDQEAETGGGFDLYDVTNPADPRPLARGVGDRVPMIGSGTPATTDDRPQLSHEYHSVFMWKDGDRAFVVGVDNNEQALTDVDIFEITDPTAPTFVGEFDLDQRFPQILAGESALGNTVIFHDVVVKEINGVQTMLASYWDGGYVLLDVDNPASPQYIGDSNFAGRDPLTNREPPEGNAHQAEFSFDNRFIVAADEDFSPYRFVGELTAGANAGFKFFSAGQPDEGPVVSREDPLTGDTRYVGRACDPATIPAATPDVTVAVAERGDCNFQVKVQNAEARGYDNVIIFNNVTGSPPCEGTLNMDFTGYTGTAKSLFVSRSIGLRLLGAFDASTYRCDPANPALSTATPAAGTEGVPLNVAVQFDGWGYAHLYRTGSGKLAEVGTPYAIPEGIDERYVESDFGILSIHEWATDPTEYLAYASYYSGGLRVASFGDNGLKEEGRFIDEGGSDIWGVEQFTASEELFRTHKEERLIAASDRDYGLYILRYTGAGAAKAPTCTDSTVQVPYKGSVTVPLPCTDPNQNNRLTRALTSAPGSGTVATVDQARGTVTYTHTGAALGVADRIAFRASDGASRSNVATVTIVAVPRSNGRCFNPFVGTAARETLKGSEFGDAIRAGAGNDRVDGLEGDDCLSGEAGADELHGGIGNDRLDGGDAGDRLFAESGRDDLRGGNGDDHLRGSSGNDTLSGGAGRDRVDGGSNNDRLNGGSGNDNVYGGPGNDALAGSSGNDLLVGNTGRNSYSGGSGNDDIRADNRRRETVRCGAGRDRVRADRTDRVARDCETVTRPRTSR